MKSFFENKGKDYALEITPLSEGYQVQFGEKIVEVQLEYVADGQLTFILDGRKIDAYVSADGKRRWVSFGGQTWMLEKSSGAARGSAGGASSGRLLAPMPGQIRAVNVSEGEMVTKGQTLIVLEAMKMEIRIQAPMEGVVARLAVEVGQTVEREEMLAEVGEIDE